MTISPASESPAPAGMDALPQYGFSTQVTFQSLLAENPFVYRVHTPRIQPSHCNNADSYFVSNKFTEDSILSEPPSSSPSSTSIPSPPTYADVAQHMDWTTRSSSPYISTSFSFAWAIWEAIRRYHANVKHDVEIAVIDARAVANHAITAVEILMQGSPKERHKDHWKWYRFALESQDVLIHGHIPKSAILATIPLLQILKRLPSYFLCHDINDAKDSSLFNLGWDYTRKKPSFRQFCQVVSDRFLQMPVDRRLRDTTAGSVRLALALLRPYFHKNICDDFSAATTHLCELAYVIAQWPGKWWSREHPEIHHLIRCIVHMIGEEMREARRVQALSDATRMQEIVGGLEQLAKAYEARACPRKLLANIALSPAPSPSPTLPPTPTIARKKALRLSALDIITDDMQESEVDPLQQTAVTEPIARESRSLAPVPQHTVASRAVEAVARTASCFLTGLLVGSFITLCVLAPDRRQLAHHLT